MKHPRPTLNCFLTLLVAGYVAFGGAVVAQTVDDLLGKLPGVDAAEGHKLTAEILSRWSNSSSATFDYLLMRGRRAVQMQDLDGAIDHLTALTDHAPDFAEGWNARATALFLSERFGPARADLERTLVLNPDHFGAWSGLAIILEQTGHPEAARAAYNNALRINPHLPEVAQAIARIDAQLTGRSL